jgi:shikimate kinase
MRIFLIGFMGTGKTYWARQLAQALYLPNFDLDDLIETQTGQSISGIFAKAGENYFRQLEADCLRQMGGQAKFVLAVGGGTACFHQNMQWMNERGITIWLNSSAATIFERLKLERDKRPLIAGKTDDALLAFIEQKIADRRVFYQQAMIHLTEAEMTSSTIIDKIALHQKHD